MDDLPEQQTGSTLARIRAALPSLLPSEQRVAEVVLARPTEVIDWSVADLAAAASTSSATTVRACQHLGFRGFQQLRLLLAKDVGAGVQPVNPDFGPGDPPEAVAAGVFATVSAVIAEGMSTVEPRALRAAADVLAGARMLLFVGNGGSSFPAQAAALRFTTAGCAVQAPQDSILQRVSARMLGGEDVCVAVSSSGSNELTVRAAEAARKAGATVIAVTGFARAPLSAVADLTLVTGTAPPVAERDVMAGPMTQLALLVALQLTTSFRRGDRAAEVMEEVWRVMAPDTRGD
ncbi:MurR/RpiR family transcriptional regulator [Prauserella flavalba]|uniref:RpiR family transcriptional regulator n=1 Tax=Prauserella flavalba TaxID=1477506 RepID=A0A318LQ58_9PSEU|nr:MurR/RpiR family transcriptional regulator [Prauserella flavalba]PXY36652.1 hypothetical protein BA062_14900 [Prauserella flavalba]